MSETAKEAAKRLAGPTLAKGFKPVALHTYTDREGEPLYWRIRAKHPGTGEKWIRPMKLNGHGFEMGEPKFEGAKPLYTLNVIANNPDALVWIVEGEQKADTLNKLGLVATTSGGATSAESADWDPLRGRQDIHSQVRLFNPSVRAEHIEERHTRQHGGRGRDRRLVNGGCGCVHILHPPARIRSHNHRDYDRSSNGSRDDPGENPTLTLCRRPDYGGQGVRVVPPRIGELATQV